MPENRFLPAVGLPDRRCDVGVLTVDDVGGMTFEASPPVEHSVPDADFAVTAVGIENKQSHHLLELRWTVNRELPEGSYAFCHVGDAEKDVRQNCRPGWGRRGALDYARSRGATMRDDSIIYKKGIRFTSDWLAEAFWRDRPVVLESGHYWSNDWSDGSDQDYFDSIEAYHGSYISIHGPPHVMYAKHKDIIAKMSQRMGYRLHPVEVSWPGMITTGQSFEVKWVWQNKGVAPCYPGGFPALTLKRPTGDICAVLTAEDIDVRDLPVGPPDEAPQQEYTSHFQIPERFHAGECDVFVSVGRRDGTPIVALPLADDDGERRYRLGTMQIRIDAEYRLRWEPPRQVGDEWQIPIRFEVIKSLPENIHPFAHLDSDSKIVKGLPCVIEGGNDAFRTPGVHPGYIRISPPEPELGFGPFPVHAGIWVLKGRRILPETGKGDLRVYLGDVTFGGEGVPILRH